MEWKDESMHEWKDVCMEDKIVMKNKYYKDIKYIYRDARRNIKSSESSICGDQIWIEINPFVKRI